MEDIEMNIRTIENYRFFLKDTIRKEIDFRTTDQNRGEPPPAPCKPCLKGQKLFDLVKKEEFTSAYNISILEAINRRKSVRRYSGASLTIKELSFLLWATQGVHELVNTTVTLRTVPSAGARHSFETYLFINKVEDLKIGIYRYLPLSHQLAFEFTDDNLSDKLTKCCYGQKFAGESAATFLWASIPYRMEWRYHLAAHKVIAIDAGHVCQNLYLACEAINAGTCAIGAYDQEKLDELLRLSGDDEFVVYLAPVGKRI